MSSLTYWILKNILNKMYIDLQELKKYSNNYSQFENLVNEFCLEPNNKDSVAYQTLNKLNFIKSDGFDLEVVEQYGTEFLTVVLTKILNNFILPYLSENFPKIG